ncbi:hypothetical protein BS47DRAFT_1360840 [Hydnum rufescens UP504]|uniref:Uncharacterized protein n=1 Tax=Hydnum rufescens UP504 TaxID=1448309 RepID=A0A9P6B159_9AGAM|nr:hypothetical protein BS47DRAFT_1360840 [Hydnum rufescens UP504]
MMESIPSLQHLLDHLPSQLPIGSSNDYPFINFTLLDECEEGVPGAVAAIFKKSFGWECEDVKLTIKARGRHVAAAALVLAECMGHLDCATNLALIEQWIKKLTKMATATYEEYGTKILQAGMSDAPIDVDLLGSDHTKAKKSNPVSHKCGGPWGQLT